ncbi:hypothetical protein [Porphyromonas pogonae]|uniref:hypothetical protein n=1 Tax=Porphyromonas pogonae TaxID=867595 RepID=UPI002E793252|nr:hypothetical protein [Porphyromonas pogonae]
MVIIKKKLQGRRYPRHKPLSPYCMYRLSPLFVQGVDAARTSNGVSPVRVAMAASTPNDDLKYR